MVHNSIPSDFGLIVQILTQSVPSLAQEDLNRMIGTRWRDSDGSEVYDPVVMARRLHAHGFIRNLDALLTMRVGDMVGIGPLLLTREA